MFVSLDMIGATPPVPGEVMSPGRYFDKTTTALRIAPKVKQAVLNEPDILQRGRVLHHVLGQVLTAAAQGPDLPKPPEQGLPPNQN